MKNTIAKNAGFCFGVKNAIDIALQNAKDSTVYTYGALIHNESVVKQLEAQNVIPVDEAFSFKKGDKVVIRAHGVSPDIEENLINKGVELLDATCPLVKKVHQIVDDYSKKGYKIIIIGSKDHPEVQGIVGYSRNNYEIIDGKTDLNLADFDKFCIVSQTTFSEKKYEEIVKNIQNNALFTYKTVVFFNTICYTTKARQLEAIELSKSNDVVFVIGSKNSSNANKLFEISSKHCKRTFFIENLTDVKSVLSIFKTKNYTLALLAAASTPNELIEEVFTFMSDTQNNTVLDEKIETAPAPEVVEESSASVNEASVATPEAEAQPKQPKVLTMDDIIGADTNKVKGFTTYREGKRVKAKVINADDSGIFCEIGGKKDGFIDKSEVSLDGSYNPADYNDGDIIEAKIINKKGDSTYVALSKREIDVVKKDEEEALAKIESNEFELEPPHKIVKNKDGNAVGLEGRIGAFTVFVPGSQLRMGRVKNLEDYIDKKLRLRKLDIKGRRVIASQRVILEEEKADRDEEFWSLVVPNTIVKGKVKRFASFGAFISVKGFDCLAHVSDLSWKKGVEPADILEIGESYDFVVLKADRETQKISLGFKQLQKKPYEIAAEKYPIGTVIKGTVARIHPFGAFVQIEDGIDGLIHVSQISHKYVKEASEILKEGQEVEAKIIGFEGNRITLSIKELTPEPVVEESVVESVDDSNDNSTKENKPKRQTNRTRKIEYDPDKVEERKRSNKSNDRSKSNSSSDEPHEWVSDSGVATLADLLKGFDLKFTDDDNK